MLDPGTKSPNGRWHSSLGDAPKSKRSRRMSKWALVALFLVMTGFIVAVLTGLFPIG